MQVTCYDNEQDMSRSLAHYVTRKLPRTLVLPGGTSPVAVVKEIAKQPDVWKGLNVTTTDERCVPVDDTQSNIGQVMRIAQSAEIRGAKMYNLLDYELPPYPADVTILGMGPDAHIASLFPEIEGVMVAGGLVKVVAPKKPFDRLSLTLDKILETKSLILLVNSKEKWNILEQIRCGAMGTTPLAQLVKRAGSLLQVHGFKE